MNFPRVLSQKGKEHKEVQSGHSVACGDILALDTDFIIRKGFWWALEDVMSSQVLVSGVSWSLFWGKGTTHSVGAGGACMQGCTLLPRAVFLSFCITSLVQKGVLEVPDQDTTSSLFIEAWFHSGNGVSNQESVLHQSPFQTQGWLSETKTLPQSYTQLFLFTF